MYRSNKNKIRPARSGAGERGPASARNGRKTAGGLLLPGLLLATFASACGIGVDGGSTVSVGTAVDRLNNIMFLKAIECGMHSARLTGCSVVPAAMVLESHVVSTQSVDSCAALLSIWPCSDYAAYPAAFLSCQIKLAPFPSSGLDQPFQGTLFTGSRNALKLTCYRVQ